ncbi:fasciclin domain-containing protein [Phenylobacterium sp.]|uniref:fasciclin domain-containing protein n=1 Tax=Phenylobacterium sp. TaxID=1871053 RepID=UPI0028111E74|nr:fasciclin domain-containing protein [Phenylobacterium sp.]
MSLNRLLSAAAVAALIASPALAQTTATAKTEAQAKAATGKPTSDAPAKTQPQGTARAVAEATPATGAAAPASTSAVQVAPKGDLIDTLKAAGQFNTFIKGADATNLTGLLKSNKNLTVFAPTDAAFQALPAAELQKLQTDKAAMQKFILHHVINAPVDSTKIKGARGPVPSGAGDQILLDGSDEAALKADGATIVQSDIRTGSGLLHVVDRVLTPGAGEASGATAGQAQGTNSGSQQ